MPKKIKKSWFENLNFRQNQKSEVKFLKNQKYNVFPAVIAKEMVMNKILYLGDELEKSVPFWNGKSIPIMHPEASVNTPENFNNRVIGICYNTQYKNKKLTCDMWINEKYTKDLGWDAINKYLAAGGTLEVSTGLQGYLEEVANNEETLAKQEFGDFKGILRDFKPDHVAIITESVGACSVEDGGGCGESIQKNHYKLEKNQKNGLQKFMEKLGLEPGAVAKNNKIANYFYNKIIFNELSQDNLRSRLSKLLRANNDSLEFYISDIFENATPPYFVFYEYKLEKFLKKEYNLSDSDEITFNSNEIEVLPRIVYDEVVSETTEISIKENKKMPQLNKEAVKKAAETFVNAVMQNTEAETEETPAAEKTSETTEETTEEKTVAEKTSETPAEETAEKTSETNIEKRLANLENEKKAADLKTIENLKKQVLDNFANYSADDLKDANKSSLELILKPLNNKDEKTDYSGKPEKNKDGENKMPDISIQTNLTKNKENDAKK